MRDDAKQRATIKAWRARNKDRVAAWNARYRAKNHEFCNAAQRDYYKRNAVLLKIRKAIREGVVPRAGFEPAVSRF